MAEYRYSGLNYRIATHYDVTDNGSKNAPDGTVDSYDPWYAFGYNERWQMIGTRRGSDSSVKERFVNHNAGLGGTGASSYIDDVILRDRDANTAWPLSADGTLEERRYLCQNWRHDVSAVISDTGKIVETVKYSAYGVPFGMPAGDTDSNGTWDATDSALMTGGTSTSDPRFDANQDGVKDSADATWANAVASGGGYQTLGRGVMSSLGVGNRKGYAGYDYEPALWGAGQNLGHVRNRILDADRGEWVSRDPAGYVDGPNLYAYVGGQVVRRTDPSGLSWCWCDPNNYGLYVDCSCRGLPMWVIPEADWPSPAWGPATCGKLIPNLDGVWIQGYGLWKMSNLSCYRLSCLGPTSWNPPLIEITSCCNGLAAFHDWWRGTDCTAHLVPPRTFGGPPKEPSPGTPIPLII